MPVNVYTIHIITPVFLYQTNISHKYSNSVTGKIISCGLSQHFPMLPKEELFWEVVRGVVIVWDCEVWRFAIMLPSDWL